MYTTLFEVLQAERIEIPIIQRDYAQGRENKVFLRERLLGKMIKALRSNETLCLDFVYGTNEFGTMWPLDGQQRLTTLWLLHWYLSVRTNQLASSRVWLNHFTYETRLSSREFCKRLCALDTKSFNESGMKIVDYIKDQTWFYSKYNQDPTIQGMLRTLGGTNITNTENKDITDGIEEFLWEDDNCLLYWNRLISDDCPIQFLFKDMKDNDLPLSDDLYIKMNARGKQLTDFENFKADLIDYAPNPDKPNDKLLDVKTASLIDNEWTDIFCERSIKKNVYKVDDIFFQFLRRYFLDCLLANSAHSIEETMNLPLYQELYKGDNAYNGLKNYGEILTTETIRHLKTLFSRWNGETIRPQWDKESILAFIPDYIIEKKDKNGNPISVEVTTISQKERAIFHAVVCYYEDNETFIKERFEDWIRFAWNIVENSNLDSESAMIGAISLFEELRTHSGSIIDFLASSKRIRSNFAARQMEEERFKSQLITGEFAHLWTPLIREAETHKFFKGSISCLLRYEDNKFVDDLDCFKQKYSNAKKYFDDNGVKDEYKIPLTQALFKLIHRWEQIQDQWLYDTKADSWKSEILNNDDPNYFYEVHRILTAKTLSEINFVNIEDSDMESEWIQSANKIKKLFALTTFLKQDTDYGEIVGHDSEWRLRWNYILPAFYPYRRHQAYLFDWIDANNTFRRNEFLHHPNIEVNLETNPECEGIYWKWTVSFDYNNYSYLWDYNNKVYLLNRQQNKKKRDSKHRNDRGDEYFCIHMNELTDISQQAFLIRLTNLAKEAK